MYQECRVPKSRAFINFTEPLIFLKSEIVGIKADTMKLYRDFGVLIAGVVDLGSFVHLEGVEDGIRYKHYLRKRCGYTLVR
jgi:hypothetical protein